MLNVHDSFDVLSLFPTATVTETANGTGVNIRDYTGKGKVIVDSEAGGGTDPTLDIKLQDSDDNSTFADITGATFTQIIDADALEAIGVNIDELGPYLRAVATIGGTNPTFAFSVHVVARKHTV